MNSARMIGLRVYLCLSCVLSAYTVLESPHVFNGTDPVGRLAAFVILLTLALIGLSDTFINDVLGHRWCLHFTDARRHNGYIMLAIANLALIFVSVNRGTEGSFLLRFALDAAMAIYVAVKDVQLRFIQPRKENLIHHADSNA